MELLKLGKRRFKGLPHHPTLESYQTDQQLRGPLGEGESATFLSALGLILYIAQDRPDIGFATKVLSTWMSRPCEEAMSAVCHLALYLAGTEEGGVLLRRCEHQENVFDRWVEQGDFMEPFGEDRRKRSNTQPGCVRGFFMGRLSFKQKINKLLNNFLERGLCPEFLKDSGYNSLELM